MLQIQHICKEYRTGTLVQKALDDVSLNFRNNELRSWDRVVRERRRFLTSSVDWIGTIVVI